MVCLNCLSVSCPLLSCSVISHRDLESLGTFLGESCNLGRKTLSLCHLRHSKFVTASSSCFLSCLLSEIVASWHWTWLFSRRKLEVSIYVGEDFFCSSWQMWSKLNLFYHFNLNFLVSIGKRILGMLFYLEFPSNNPWKIWKPIIKLQKMREILKMRYIWFFLESLICF